MLTRGPPRLLDRAYPRAFFWLLLVAGAWTDPSWGQADVLQPPPDSPAPKGSLGPVGDTVPSASALVAPGGIVAIVGDEVITQADLERRLQQQRAQLSAMFPANVIEREIPRLAWLTMEQMVADRLIVQLVRVEEQKQEGRQMVTAAEIDFQVERQVERVSKARPEIKTTDDLYRMAQEVDGLSRQEYRKFLKERIEVEKYLREFVLRGAETYVSPEETRVYYLTHLDEFTTPVEIAFRQILISLNREDALARKEAVEAGLKAGESFVELAKLHSQEAVDGRPEAAGHIFRKSFEELSSWHRPIPEVLRKMKAGEVSEPVRTVAGIHYFYVEELVPGEPKLFGDAQETIRNQLRVERETTAIQEFIDGLKERAFWRVFIARPPGLQERGSGAEEEVAPSEKPAAEPAVQPAAEPAVQPAAKPEPAVQPAAK